MLQKMNAKLNNSYRSPLAILLTILLTTVLLASVLTGCNDDQDNINWSSVLEHSEQTGSSGYGNHSGEISGGDSSGDTSSGGPNEDESTTVDNPSSSGSNTDPTTDSTTDPTTEPTTDPTTEPATKPTTTKPTTTKPTTTKPTTTQPTTTAPVKVDYNVTITQPVASGTKVSNMNGYIIDYSNMADGYVMVKSTGSATAYVQVYLDSKSGTKLGQYKLEGNEYMPVPLTKGANTYMVRVLELTSAGKGVQKNAITEYASISPETKAYIQPNIYVQYTKDSTAVRVSCELAAGKTTKAAKVKAFYEYIINNIDYDYEFAKYVADNAIDNYTDTERCLKNKKGICGDYAALFATMCRAHGIPCMVVNGYVIKSNGDQEYHAWNKVYLDGEWKFYDTTFDAGGSKGKSYIEMYYY